MEPQQGKALYITGFYFVFHFPLIIVNMKLKGKRQREGGMFEQLLSGVVIFNIFSRQLINKNITTMNQCFCDAAWFAIKPHCCLKTYQ